MLDAAARQAVDAHLAACAACRGLLAEVRSADAAARAALAWAEPSPAFAPGVAARARRRIILGRLAVASGIAAVVAVAVCVVLSRAPRTPTAVKLAAPEKRELIVEPQGSAGSLVAGEAYDAYGLPAGRLVPGRLYAAAEPAALSVDPGSLLLVARGSQFTPATTPGRSGPGVSILSGGVVGQVGSRGKELAIELAPELGGAVVRTRGCEFYSYGFPAHRLAAGMPFPAGSLALWPEEIGVHVFSGHLDLDLGTQKLALGAGDSAVIAGGVSAGTADSIGKHIGQLHDALGTELIEQRDLYARLRNDYAHRLLELRSASRQDGLPHLQERLELVDELLRDHSAALSRLEAAHPEFFELDAAAAEQRRLNDLHDGADHALERFVALLDNAR